MEHFRIIYLRIAQIAISNALVASRIQVIAYNAEEIVSTLQIVCALINMQNTRNPKKCAENAILPVRYVIPRVARNVRQIESGHQERNAHVQKEL
jgi:hypothetical protein